MKKKVDRFCVRVLSFQDENAVIERGSFEKSRVVVGKESVLSLGLLETVTLTPPPPIFSM